GGVEGAGGDGARDLHRRRPRDQRRRRAPPHRRPSLQDARHGRRDAADAPPVAAAADVPADGAFPYALLEGAHRELARLYVLHAGAGYVCGVIYVHTIKKVRGYLCTATKV
ncbi:unnamed protein product, partial [Urochloa humidicola]